MIRISLLFAFLSFSGLGILNAQTIQEPETELYFKTEIRGRAEKGKKLGVTGLGCREKVWVNVYAIAHYADYAGLKNKLSRYKGKSYGDLKSDNDFYKDLSKADIEKVFYIQMTRDVDQESIEEAFREGLKHSYEDGKLSKNANDFLKIFSDGVSDKDLIIFRAELDGKFSAKIIANRKVRKKFTIEKDSELIQATWQIWFTKKPSVGTDLRDALVSEIHRAWK